MSQSPRYLVLGASGLIGAAFRRCLSSEDAAFTYKKNPFTGGLPFDPTRNRLRDLGLNLRNCTHAFVLFANSKPDSCLADPVASQAINVDSLHRLIPDLLALHIQPVFASTEFVFDGQKGNYSEADSPNPILLYGQQKLEAEKLVQSLDKNILIFRLAKSYGLAAGDGTFFTQWLKELETRPAMMRGASDQAFSPLSSDNVAQSMLAAAQRNLTGLYHLSGNKRYTRLELLEMLLSQVRHRMEISTQARPCSIHDFPLPEKRPPDVSLDASKLAATRCLHVTPIEQDCSQLVERWCVGRTTTSLHA